MVLIFKCRQGKEFWLMHLLSVHYVILSHLPEEQVLEFSLYPCIFLARFFLIMFWGFDMCALNLSLPSFSYIGQLFNSMRCKKIILAGIMALCATSSYYDSTEIATRILPNIVVLTIDPDKWVCCRWFLHLSVFCKRCLAFMWFSTVFSCSVAC